MMKINLATWGTLAFMCCCPSATQADEIDFIRDVRPILSDYCYQCHGPDEDSRQADLRLDQLHRSSGDLADFEIIVPFEPETSLLVDRINDSANPMPPDEFSLSLSDAQKGILEQWIAEGAKHSVHWSFVTPTRPDVPGESRGQNPIDSFVGERLATENLWFSPEASPERLIRRVTLDLTGLPPSVEEIDQFTYAYERDSEQAWSDLVDRLIGSPSYGERMALPWLEAARYADTDGYQYDGPRHQWRWRDWVIAAYNANMPFDEFTITQLAGDLLPEPTLDQRIATGFNRNHRYNSEAGLVVEEFLLENAVDRVDTTATLWMGLTIGCSRCHDHKYDPFSQREYYQLIAFFNSVPEAGRAIKNGNSEPIILAPTSEQQDVLASKRREVEEAWIALEPGEVPQQGGALIDRKLVHRFRFNSEPVENVDLHGSPSFGRDGLVLDGQSSISLKELGNEVNFRANSSFSIAFWLKLNSLDDQIVLSRQNTGTTRPGVELAITNNGSLRFDLVTRWVAGLGRARSIEKLPLEEWVHITVTNDGSQSANGQLIYFNGEPVATEVTYNTNSNVGGVNQNRPMTIGTGLRSNVSLLNGQLRDLRMYKTALWPEEIDILAAEYGGPRRQRFSRIKMTSDYEQFVSLRESLEQYKRTLPTAMVMEELPEPKPTYVRIRGVYDAFGEQVERGTPAIFPKFETEYRQDRLGFAKWLVSPDHPLTARVAVNRYWQMLFGVGLVKTAEDFGIQGELPSHPQLLDWLAVEFVESGWDVAAMLKLIVSSRTYRQQSNFTAELLERDPENRLLARGPRMRLSGHAIRDQALFVSGLLNETIGGPSVSPYQPENLWQEMSMGMRYRQSQGDDLYRRSIYTIWKRTVAPPAMAVFDAADREACWVNRKETNTPLQALTLMNETGFVESARNLATRMLTEPVEDPIEFGFRSVTARHPTEAEFEILRLALSEYQTMFSVEPENARRLIRVGESSAPEGLDAVELAAYTALANLLLNLDEVITRE